MGYCGKYCYQDSTVSAHNGKFRQTGVNVCDSPLCAVCSERRSMKEAEQVSNLIKFAKHKNKVSFFVTPTQPKITSIRISYLNVVEGYKKIRKYLSNVKQNKGITVSVYAAPEYTFEKTPYYNGVDLITRAHNHLHMILIFWSEVDSQCQQEVIDGVCKQWNAVIKKSGSYTRKNNKSIDIQRIDYNSDSIDKISNYITKGIAGSEIEQMALEITQSNSKIGKGRSFKRLLEDIVRFEKSEDIIAYKSLINVTYKKRRVYKNDTFKEYLELANEWIEEEKRKITEEYLKQMNEGLITLQDFLDWKCKEENGKTLEEMKIEKEETVELTIPQDIFNMIGFRGANSYMRKLVVNASLGFNIHLFEEFKSFCVENKHYSNPNRRIDDRTRQIDKMILIWKQSFCL